MKNIFIHLFILFGLLPFPSMAQIGIADPVTGNAAINFWGKVVDQDNNPLPGAQINLALDYGSSTAVIERKAISLKADQNGDFALKNEQGHGFDIQSIVKPGYKLSPKVLLSYSYSWSANIFHPDENNPVVFRMWKKMGGEPLITDSKFYVPVSVLTIDTSSSKGVG